jgi:Rieske Fe-S protein
VTSRRSALLTLGLGLLAACESTIARLKGRKLVRVAAADSVSVTAAPRMTVADQPLIVVNDGRHVRTFVAVCTHEGCPLGWNPMQRLIRCPCHGSAFDTSGRVVEGPAREPLTELETVVENGGVWIDERALASNPRS